MRLALYFAGGRSIRDNLKKERARISKAIEASVAEYNKYLQFGRNLPSRRTIVVEEMMVENPEFPWWGEEAEIASRGTQLS